MYKTKQDRGYQIGRIPPYRSIVTKATAHKSEKHPSEHYLFVEAWHSYLKQQGFKIEFLCIQSSQDSRYADYQDSCPDSRLQTILVLSKGKEVILAELISEYEICCYAPYNSVYLAIPVPVSAYDVQEINLKLYCQCEIANEVT